ncbi:MAG: class I SAM-dependent methyltransferase [Roseburia sp.]|nr:class I SAM-dependent methyltransferase [Roseburia sp.]MCM1097576.1 class I SAM-dependent methyltransferase [Ruminococcus flavefaciens]
MWIANHWKDYEVLDTSGGEKLERWGDYLLVRPDPQVIWSTPRKHPGWAKRNGHYHRSAKGGGEWEFFHLPDEWSIGYDLYPAASPGTVFPSESIQAESSGVAVKTPPRNVAPTESAQASPSAAPQTGKGQPASSNELRFHLKPFSFKHTGLFPEQAVNWDWFSQLIRRERRPADRPLRVLNLFAYTGGATLAAAAAGAAVTHVDASKGMVTWAKENAAGSGLAQAPIRWLVDDCAKFVEREIRRGNKYDAIIMDPPSYGRGPKGEIWKIEESLWPFLELTVQILSDEPLFFLINSYTTGLQPAVLAYLLGCTVAKRFGGRVEAEEIGLPVRESGLTLPCGASGRWSREGM